MEIDVTMQFDDEKIRMENDQFMEYKNEHDFEQVTIQKPLLVQEISIPTKQVSNLLPISTKPIQRIQFKHVQLVQLKPIYIFLEMSVAYAQHESLKRVTLFFEQVALIAQTWPLIINNLTNLKTMYNSAKTLLEDTNNQLHAYCLELVNHKQALQNRDKELATMKV